MKARFYTVAAAAAMVFAANTAAASNIEIDINGEVIDATCLIDGGNKKSEVINLDKVSKNILFQAGETSSLQEKTFTFTGCPEVATGSIGVRVDNPSADIVSPGILKNTLTTANGGADNVGIRIRNNGTPLELANSYKFNVANDGTAGSGKLVVGAEYYATGAATVGLVKSKLYLTVGYK